MKNVLRNDLWMMIVSWCLILNNYSILAIVVAILASCYLSMIITNKNYWRILSIVLICFASCYLLSLATIIHTFKYFSLFAIALSVNVALLNERLYKERLYNVHHTFIIMMILFLFFGVVALVLPYQYVLANSKESLYALLIMIFIPYTSEILAAFIRKEYDKKRLLDKIKAKTPRMYN